MPSTPLIASSSGVATVSAMTFGLAPGYCARTTIEGGTTSGYSAIGRLRSAIRPARKISSDRTPAKIGRSMKNLDRFMALARGSGLRHRLARPRFEPCVHRPRLRVDERARPDALKAADD